MELDASHAPPLGRTGRPPKGAETRRSEPRPWVDAAEDEAAARRLFRRAAGDAADASFASADNDVARLAGSLRPARAPLPPAARAPPRIAKMSRIRRIGASGYSARAGTSDDHAKLCCHDRRSSPTTRRTVLAARVEALAEALRTGGVSEEASAQLLSRASATVLQALNLELLTAEASRVPETKATPGRRMPGLRPARRTLRTLEAAA